MAKRYQWKVNTAIEANEAVAPLLTWFCSRFSSYSGLRESRLDNPEVRTASRVPVYGYNGLTKTLQILLS